jgi:hypothetical protein
VTLHNDILIASCPNQHSPQDSLPSSFGTRWLPLLHVAHDGLFFIWHKISSLFSWYNMLFSLRLIQDVLPSSTDARFLYVFSWLKMPFSLQLVPNSLPELGPSDIEIDRISIVCRSLDCFKISVKALISLNFESSNKSTSICHGHFNPLSFPFLLQYLDIINCELLIAHLSTQCQIRG